MNLFSGEKFYLWGLAATLTVSSIVKWEPAAFDLLILVMLVWGMAAGFLRKPSAALRWPMVLLALFLLTNSWYFFHHPYSPDATRFFTISVYCILLWFFFVLILDYFKLRGLHYILFGCALSGILSFCAGTMAYTVGFRADLLLYKGHRVAGLFKDPNVFGPYMIPILIFGLALLWSGVNRHSWMVKAALVAGTVGVVISFSRAAWLNMVIALIAFFSLLALNKCKIKPGVPKNIIGCGLAILFFLIAINIFNPNLEQTITGRLGSNHGRENTQLPQLTLQYYDVYRFSAQRQALEMSLVNPWGIGPGQTFPALDYDTHNTYLRTALENGWLGFFSFTGFLLISLLNALRLSIRQGSRYRLIYISTSAILLGIVANSFFIDTLHWRHFWIILALAWIDFDKDTNYEGRELWS